MAVYEFECQSCGKRFEISVAITEHDRLKNRPPACPTCGKPKIRQLASTFSCKAPLASTERFAAEGNVHTDVGWRPATSVRPLSRLLSQQPPSAASLGLGVFLGASSPRDFTTRALDR